MFSRKNKPAPEAEKTPDLKEQVSLNENTEVKPGGDEAKPALFQSLKSRIGGIKRTFFAGLAESLVGEKEVDEDVLDEIEERLLISDIGVHTARQVIGILQEEFGAGRVKTMRDATAVIKKIFSDILGKTASRIEMQASGVTVIMLIGVNGTGKTTSIGKLAAQYVQAGKKVMIVAGDTFRAAAIDQLKVWSERSGAEFFAKSSGADPAAVMYEASQKANAGKFDVLLCDTSGRLHTKKHLMDELEKMKRVIAKNIPGAPHYTVLTLDASSGQNAVKQAKEFREIIGYEGLILTKMDGSSKGGVVVSIVNEYKIPVYYIGLGEQVGDLYEFKPDEFIDGIFG